MHEAQKIPWGVLGRNEEESSPSVHQPCLASDLEMSSLFLDVFGKPLRSSLVDL